MLPIVNMEYDGVDASHSEHLVLLLVTVKYIYSVMLDPNSNILIMRLQYLQALIPNEKPAIF